MSGAMPAAWQTLPASSAHSEHFISSRHAQNQGFCGRGSKIKPLDREQLLECSQVPQSAHLNLSPPQSQRRVLNASPGLDKRLRTLGDHQVSTSCPPFTDTTDVINHLQGPDASSWAGEFHHRRQRSLSCLLMIHVRSKRGHKVGQGTVRLLGTGRWGMTLHPEPELHKVV